MLIIKHHSFVDVITNSSTELFIGDYSKGIECITEIITEIINVYNLKTSSKLVFDDVFSPITMINDENLFSYLDLIIDYIYPDDELWNNVSSYPIYPEYNINDSVDVRRERRTEYNRQIECWKEENKTVLLKTFAGKIVIKGIRDNSIPYQLNDMLESLFTEFTHFHLG